MGALKTVSPIRSSHPEDRLSGDRQRGLGASDLTPAAEPIRDALALRHPEWDPRRPTVLDLAAEALAPMHARLVGRVAKLEALRPAKYVREALRGERALAVEDLALLALDEPDALVAGLEVLAAAAGYRLEPLEEGRATVGQSAGDFAMASASVQNEVTRAIEDGEIDPDERQRIRTALDVAKSQAAALEAALARAERRR